MADNVSPILMTDYLVTNTEMTAVADAIRGKAGTAGQLSFPDGFVSAIQGIQAESTLQEKVVTPTTSQQDITPDSGYDGLSKVTIAAMPTAEQATPNITVSSSGLITATSEQSEGYVALGTKSSTQQLTTQAAKTVTPGTANQTAVASGRYTTGAVTVKGDANLVAGNIKSGVSIFGVAGTLKTGSKPLNFFVYKDYGDVTVDSSGYINIAISHNVVEDNNTPNLIYVEGTAFNAAEQKETVWAIRQGNVGDNVFKAHSFDSGDGLLYLSNRTFISYQDESTLQYCWKWMIDPGLVMGRSYITITTIVLGG